MSVVVIYQMAEVVIDQMAEVFMDHVFDFFFGGGGHQKHLMEAPFLKFYSICSYSTHLHFPTLDWSPIPVLTMA